ncbi:MAG: HAD hydrolase family protein [Candidatus Omnitrophica bacterium]|nr:HAD hydrolase family protein [Candidatus Omnitrophota bacterium]MCA9428116.1 HAD hydrolase family protein [Candidatus Omnitrophota bacterium]MCA9436179.1 HAD hydrolase family protein [Candidatus Omnitrophota bacterium]
MEKCQPVRLLLTDVDGVLTDGGLYYGEKGDELKKFSVRDGAAAKLLKEGQFILGALTSDRSALVQRRLKRIGFDFLYYGISDKLAVVERIREELSLGAQEIAYIGDEINDLPLIGNVGFFMTVLDGNPVLRKKADCVLKVKGGEGALREAAVLLLRSKGCFETTLEKSIQADRQNEDPNTLIQKFLRFRE